MILTIMIFILFCFVLFSKNYNNKITYAFMVYMLGIISLVFSVLLYLSKFSDYSFPLKLFFLFDTVKVPYKCAGYFQNI